MPNSIGNRSAEQITEAIEFNLIDSATVLGRNQEGVVFHDTQVTWVYSGFRALSRVLGNRFDAEEAEDRIAEIAECFRQWDAPVLWVVGPNSRPPKLPEFLADSGFGMSENWFGTAGDLAEIQLKHSPVKGVRIEKITEPEQFKSWVHLSSESWGADAVDGAISIFSTQNAGSDPRCGFYLAHLNDRPVARCMTCTTNDTVGLYWVATASEYQQAGYDVAVCAQALTEAKLSGCKVGVMTTNDMDNSVSGGLGFKQYCQFNVYAWPASPIPMPAG